MTYLGGKALIVTALLMVCLLGSTIHAQVDPSQNELVPQGNILYDGQESTILMAVINLRWTAPGDDGNTGRAARYDLRARPASYGPIDTQQEWDQAVQFSNEPNPSLAGQMDSMTITGLLPGAQYYCCIRTYDEANNVSDFSNSPLLGGSTPNYFIAGDVNNSGEVNGMDLVFLINYLKGRAEIPEPIGRADVNGLPRVNGLDAVYLRAYFSGGPPPRYPAEMPEPAGPASAQAIVRDGNM